MIQFYAPDLEQTLTLPEGESTHCCRVLRLREGSEIDVTDGKGNRFRCEITDAHPKHTQVRIIDKQTFGQLHPYKVTIAVAPTKNIDRIEWLLEKSVEVGVDRIVLVSCSHSERKNVNEERLERIILSAMNQSLKTHRPEFGGLMKLSDFLKEEKQQGDARERYVGYCSPEIERHGLSEAYTPGKDVTLLIGPEGDFSPEEIELALDCGFRAATFGEMRLRTETAALYGLQSIHILNELSNHRN